MGQGVVVWFTGLPSSGKSTLAERVARRLEALGNKPCLLDGDALRSALVPRPGYSATERAEFYETLGNLAAYLAGQGLSVLVAATAQRAEFREHAKKKSPRFYEVWVSTDVEECRARDAKGLYAGARSGSVAGLAGADADYEAPKDPSVTATGGYDEQALERVVELIRGGAGDGNT